MYMYINVNDFKEKERLDLHCSFPSHRTNSIKPDLVLCEFSC